MFNKICFFPRRVALLLALSMGAAMVRPGSLVAQSSPAADSGELVTPSATLSLINRLSERGVLSKQDAADLVLIAEADAADARAQKAMLQAALAQAAAAQARLKAVTAQLGRRTSTGTAVAQTRELPAVSSTEDEEAERAPRRVRAVEEPEPVVTRRRQVEDPALVSSVAPTADAAEQFPQSPAVRETKSRRTRPAPVEVAEEESATAPAPTAAHTMRTPAGESMPAPAEAETDEAAPSDTVRVTYVPEVVKAQLREEIKQEVLAQARDENWANPRTFPDWVSKFRLFGDIRFRYEGIKFPAAKSATNPTGNDNTGSFPNFNAINTGAPFDTSGTVFSPQFDVDQNRNRLRLRARMGAAVDLGQNFSAGLRLATGENNSPVTQNQSLGAAGSGQGGNFSKYAVWLDRAYLKYEWGGLPDQDLAISLGRFDNPFMSTPVIWADDLGFDGMAAQGKFPLGEDITPFFTVGAFPVFNTDLNFASNQPAKFKSIDKWLYAAQLGSTFEFGKNISLKLGAAYYSFSNIEGQLSTPFIPLTSADAGNTDASRPAFAQKGNTYMALRDIVPGPLNNNGKIDQFQYFGLASKFAVMALDARLDFNHFEPFQISLVGEYLKNRSFDPLAIGAIAVNNLGPVTTTSPNGVYLGTNTAWLAGFVVGNAALKQRWDWNVAFNYRKVGSDAVVDGFNDSDFGGGGTNVKGFTVGGNLALSPGVWIGLRWFSASEVVGPVFKNDIFQLDFNGKF